MPEIFYPNNFKCNFDKLLSGEMQALLWFGKSVIGRWLFKPDTSAEKMKTFVAEKITEYGE